MGSDPLAGEVLGASCRFNSRSRMGSDCVALYGVSVSFLFQFTLPHGERQPSPTNSSPTAKFQFTLPHGERPTASPSPTRSARFQFTLPHGERPAAGRAAKGVPASFNSRSRMGSDPRGGRRRGCPQSFNSRSRMGSDSNSWSMYSCVDLFQFTLPHGERPHAHIPFGARLGVSIHAPAWGATREVDWRDVAHLVSIHAPAWGATRRPPALTPQNERFQFTLPHGERQHRAAGLHPLVCFNSRSRMGSDMRRRKSL